MATVSFASWARLDLTQIQHGRRILASVIVDSVGSGLMLAFVPLYFTTRAQLSAGELGTLMTLGALLSLPAGTLTSSLVARIGPSRAIQAINYARAVAGVLALVATTREVALLALFLASWGENAFWAANGTFVSDVTGDLRQRWYAVERSIRNAAVGLGALAGGLSVTLAATGALVTIMGLNAASYAVAGALLIGVVTAPRPVETAAGSRRSLRPYADPQLLLVLGITVALVVPMLAFTPLLMLTLASQAEWGALLTGGLVGVNVVILVIWQPSFTAWTEATPRAWLLAGCGAAIALSGAALALGMRSHHNWALAAGAVAAILLVTACELGTNASLYEMVASIAPSQELPNYMAAYQLAWALSSVVWPATVLPMLSLSSWAAWLAVAILGLVAVGLAAGLRTTSAVEAAVQTDVNRQLVTETEAAT